MVEVEEMESTEMYRLLEVVGYGHLGCTRENRPYVVPIHYAYEHPHIYIFTTEGMKTEFIADNPEVCLQIEEVDDSTNWKSVVATGKAERLTTRDEIEHATGHITQRNPSLTPALSKMWIDPWGRASTVVLYRITPHMVSGRKTVPAGETRGPGRSGGNETRETQ